MQFLPQTTLFEIEEGDKLRPKFNEHDLIPCITQDHASGEVLMLGWMNPEALAKTIETGLAHYYSRSRQKLWKKGEQSGLFQHVISLIIDDDQDAVLIKVKVDGGASCHVGYRSCFFRQLARPTADTDFSLIFLEAQKTFDPVKAYGLAASSLPSKSTRVAS
ncbi:phosphoribosyl-AMP cyclohydrolase [Termitidicoccus mucosus]|uniref:Phosphoribosyl-AMP cyclohydrolase n=1 Tax=Termitidicoccus mucosus TaxID=1184151 RepID=A0A178IMD0_9BACT|nr:phosphoribosyl-AMP cyclohydrolase [Opitutaceae bacterium TSB47]